MSDKSGGETEKNDRLQQLINYGVPNLVLTQCCCKFKGLFGPEGAVIGGIVGKGVEIWLSLGQDISERHLSTREKVRVGAVLIAAEEIQAAGKR